MKRTYSTLLLPLAILALAGASYGTVSVKWPADTVAFKPGPGADVTNANCSTCHSASYVYTQPPLTKVQWTAEVKKMKAVYGAPIADDDAAAIVDYLVAQNGKP